MMRNVVGDVYFSISLVHAVVIFAVASVGGGAGDGGDDGGVCMRLISCRMFLHIVVQGLWINWHFVVLYMCCLLRTTSAIACSLLYFVSPCNFAENFIKYFKMRLGHFSPVHMQFAVVMIVQRSFVPLLNPLVQLSPHQLI